jgi:hypothetical protein
MTAAELADELSDAAARSIAVRAASSVASVQSSSEP